MAQSPGERIAAIEQIVGVHNFRPDASAKEVDATHDAHKELERAHGDLRRNFDREVALLQREIDELKRWKEDFLRTQEEWGRKLWMILPPVVAVLVSNAITLLITIYVKK